MTSRNAIDFFAHANVPQAAGLEAVLAALPEARLVGGAVRDGLLGLPVADIDLAAPMPPETIMARLAASGLRSAPTGLAHGTVTAISAGHGFEITTLRRDESTDGRHAAVAWTDDWQQDAARRDFTINALYQSADGQVWDYVGGLADLQAGVVQFVGDAATRIREDYLRILRFFRFHARYGRVAPDPALLEALHAHADGLQRLSAERIWSEWRRILGGPDPLGAAELMAQTGILPIVMPEGFAIPRLRRLLEIDAPADPILRLAALLTGDDAALAKRLRLSNRQAADLHGLRTAPLATPDMDDAALRRLLADHPASWLAGRVWLSAVDETAARRLAERLEQLPKPIFPVQGADLMAAGMPPGPAVGAILRDLRAWWLAGGCTADAAACRAELAKRRTD